MDEQGRLIVVSTRLEESSSEEIRRLRDDWMLYSADGELIDTLGAAPGMAGVVHASADRMEVLKPLVAPTTTYAVGGGSVWIERGEDYRVDRYDLKTQMEESIRWAGPDLSLTSNRRDAIIEALASNVPAERRAGYRASLERRPVPKTMPAIERVLADRSGRGWLKFWSLPNEAQPAEWVVFDAGGQPQAKLEVPSSMAVLSVMPGTVLVVARDEFDVEQLRLYRVEGW